MQADVPQDPNKLLLKAFRLTLNMLGINVLLQLVQFAD